MYCAVHPEISEKKLKGKYFVPVGHLGETSSAGRDVELASKVWTWTEEVLREKGYYKEWSI
jgi:hypothetical protein